jgi:LUD domain
MTADETVDPGAVTVADALEGVAEILRSNNIEAVIVENGDEARAFVLDLIPEGAEVHSGKSKTLEDIGLFSEITDSGRYDTV